MKIKNIIGLVLTGIGLISFIIINIVIFGLLPIALFIGLIISFIIAIAGCIILFPGIIEKIKGLKK